MGWNGVPSHCVRTLHQAKGSKSGVLRYMNPRANQLIEGTSISCSAYMMNADHPLLQFSERADRVALSNHADFVGTLAYVETTGAKRIVTDNIGSHGVDLAIAINNRFPGIRAEPSSNSPAPF